MRIRQSVNVLQEQCYTDAALSDVLSEYIDVKAPITNALPQTPQTGHFLRMSYEGLQTSFELELRRPGTELRAVGDFAGGREYYLESE